MNPIHGPADESPAKKLARSMRDLVNPQDGISDLGKISGLPSAAGGQGAAGEALARGLNKSIIESSAATPALRAGELGLSRGIDAGGFAAYHASARKPIIAQPDPPARNAALELARKVQSDIFGREQRQRQKQEERAEEALELQRRAVAASETALEEERERTREARAEAAVQTKARKKADRLALLGIAVGVAGLFIAAWPFIKEQF